MKTELSGTTSNALKPGVCLARRSLTGRLVKKLLVLVAVYDEALASEEVVETEAVMISVEVVLVDSGMRSIPVGDAPSR